MSENSALPAEIEEQVAELPQTHTLYYDDPYLQTFEARILKSIVIGAHSYVILDRTAFFPEGGGQPGDQGTIEAQGTMFEVIDTKPAGQATVHILDRPFQDGDISVKGSIDWPRRYSNMKHHTAAHIVFSAVRNVLNMKDLRYMGFQISRDRVRIDLNREESITPEQLREIEATANQIALKQLPVRTSSTTRDEAVKRFGGELGLTEVTPTGDVRLVEIGDQDVSLCCGTHVRSTIEVAPIKILGRLRLQKGIERLEVSASEYGYAEFSRNSEAVSKLTSLLDSDIKDIVPKVQQLLTERERMKDELRKMRMTVAESEALQYLSDAEQIGDLRVVSRALKDVDADVLKRMALKITYNDQDSVAVLGSSDGATHVVAAVGSSLVKRGINVSAMVTAAAAKIGCRGGGADNLAQTGGIPADRLTEFMQELRETIIRDASRRP